MTRNKKTITVLCLFAIAVVSVIFGSVAAIYADGKQGWSECEISSEYAYKSELNVKKRRYTAGNKSYDATALICFPDGRVSSSDKVVLDCAGTYSVKYSVRAEDKVYADSVNFSVSYPNYDVSSVKSSVKYGIPERSSSAGVIARMVQNDSLSFTKFIDFTKVTADDYLVKGYVVPEVANAADFTELTFTFTDSVDPSVYMTIHCYGYDWTYNTYIAANGQNQVPFGVHQNNAVLHTNDGYGTWSYVSFKSAGQNGVVAPDATQFYFSMDYAEKKLYCLGYPGVKTFCADLDDSSLTSNLWTGFPSGKARLSVGAVGYTGSAATVCITEVFGIDELHDNVFIDSEKPNVFIDDEYEKMPIGAKGYEYAVPDAYAYDEYAGNCEVEVSVWFNYGMDNAVKVPVSDGRFRTDRVGTYGIVYGAQDKLGNYAEEVRLVTVYDKTSDASFSFPEDTIKTAKIGEWVKIPVIGEADVDGGSGKKTITTFIEKDGERKEIFGGFRADTLGTTKIVYSIRDYIGKVTEQSYEVEVTASDLPVLEKDCDFYPVYISGCSYVLPAFYAYKYENGSLRKELCDVTVKDANGETEYKAGDEATVTVAENGDKIEFVVSCGGAILSVHEAVGVLAWVNEEDGRRFHVENYLVGEGFSTEKTSEGMILTATSQEKMSFLFANALSVRYTYLKTDDIFGFCDGAVLTVRLTDAADASNGVCATVGRSGNEIYAEVEGNRHVFIGATADEGFSVSVVIGIQSITINDFTFGLKNAADFESDKAFLQISYEGYSEGASVRFSELGNCRFGTSKADRVEPIIFSQEEIGGTFLEGAKYTIKAPVAYDVYSPNVKYILNVTAPDGTFVTAADGTVLKDADPSEDYVIVLSEIGEYVVRYNIEESKTFASKNNPTYLSYFLKISDKEPPEIVWNGKFVSELRVDDIFVVPSYTVSDNNSAEENIIVRVFVETPAHQLIMLPGNSIRMTHEGVYKIRVMVVDEVGNITNQTHYVTVRGRS